LGGLGPGHLDEAHDLRFAAVAATSEQKPVDVVARLERRWNVVGEVEEGSFFTTHLGGSNFMQIYGCFQK